MNNSYKKFSFLILSLWSLSIFAADNGIHDDQFAKETASKLARAAQREQEELQTQVASNNEQSNDVVYRKKELKDGCAILFQLNQRGLPIPLRNIIFNYLQEFRQKNVFTCDEARNSRLKYDSNFNKVYRITTHTDPQGKIHIIALSCTGNIYIFDENGQLEHTLENTIFNDHLPLQTCNDAYGNWYIVVSSIQEERIEIWDGATGKVIRTFSTDTGDSTKTLLGIHSDTQSNLFIILYDNRGAIEIQDLRTGNKVQTFEYDNKEDSGSRICFTKFIDAQNNLHIVTGNNTDQGAGVIRVWNTANGNLVQKFNTDNPISECDQLGVHLDTQKNLHIVSIRADNSIQVWNGATGMCSHTIDRNSFSKICPHTDKQGDFHVAFHNKKSNSDPLGLYIWNMKTNNVISCEHNDPHNKPTCGTTGWETHIYTNVDGNWYIVTAMVDNSLCIWDGATGKLIDILRGHSDSVSACSYTDAQGNWHIISGSEDQTIRLWCLAPGTFEREKINYQKEIERRKKFNKSNKKMELDFNYDWDFHTFSDNPASNRNSNSSSSHNALPAPSNNSPFADDAQLACMQLDNNQKSNAPVSHGEKRKNEEEDNRDNTKRQKTTDTRDVTSSNSNSSNACNADQANARSDMNTDK